MYAYNPAKYNSFLRVVDKSAKGCMYLGVFWVFLLIPYIFYDTPLSVFFKASLFLSLGLTVLTTKKWVQTIAPAYSMYPRHLNFALALLLSSVAILIILFTIVSYQAPHSSVSITTQSIFALYPKYAVVTSAVALTTIPFFYSYYLFAASQSDV